MPGVQDLPIEGRAWRRAAGTRARDKGQTQGVRETTQGRGKEVVVTVPLAIDWRAIARRMDGKQGILFP